MGRGSWKVQVDQSYYLEPEVYFGQSPEYRRYVPGTWGCWPRKRFSGREIIHPFHEGWRREAFDLGIPRSKCEMVCELLHPDGFITYIYTRSPAINMEDIGIVHVRLPSSEHTSNLVRVDIKIDASTFFIYIQDAEDHWPFKIENESDYVVDFTQMARVFRFACPLKC
jgi:hypothetical protein